MYEDFLFPTGPSASVITLTGSGFGTDPQLVSVTINNADCEVTSVSDSQVQCSAGDSPGGTYPVMLHHEVKGYAQSDVSFSYELTLTSVQPNEGQHGVWDVQSCCTEIHISPRS